jgi:hypothetical protein
MNATKKETAEQKRLRQAKELVDAAKKQERDAWRATWEAQQKDPEYQRKQTERRAKSEERSCKIAIGKENKRLEFIAKYSDPDLDELYETAIHESCHAVMQELVANGVSEVTIVPGISEANAAHGITKDGVYAGCSSAAGASISTDMSETVVWRIATTIAPQVGMPRAFLYYQDLGEDYDPDIHGGFEDEDEFEHYRAAYEAQFGGDEKIIEKTFKELAIPPAEAGELRSRALKLVHKSFSEPAVWAAVLEVADALMTDKTLSGNDVRLIVRKHTMPHLGIQFDAGKQLSFHYRKNRYQCWHDHAPFIIGVGVTTGTASYYSGYTLSNPDYVKKVTDENAKPVPFPCKPAHQMSFVFAPHVVRSTKQKKSRKKSEANRLTVEATVGAPREAAV